VAEATGAARSAVWLRVGREIWLAVGRRSTRCRRRRGRRPARDARVRSIPRRPAPGRATQRPQRDEAGRRARDARGGAAPGRARLPAPLVLRNARLIEELHASRRRLVAAQDEERRRLERNLHDGAQQQLVARSVKLNLVNDIAGRDPRRAEGRSHRRAEEPPGPGTRHLPAAARRQGPGGCARRAGMQGGPSSRPTGSGATGRRSRPPCTSAAWRRCRTS
jgi:hypothetical protein